ncbi:MAG: hypothetical protein GXY83_24475 [Rhodopirellula sp.]|nr:hypothetical protein [Rhodopirellula sp.]
MEMLKSAAHRGNVKAHFRPHLQFTLRALMIGTAIASMVLGSAIWKGPIGAIVSLAGANVFVVALFAYRGRRQPAIRSSFCLAVPIVGMMFYLFGPGSIEETVCPMCGKLKYTETFLGVMWRETRQPAPI